ncbi:hypothetical protein GCM10009863_43340 [Streptomyces axinellae]|uniref:Uncharacterized protein n=1 Tax=Streptomyces axinellae TaxID=552788 RepID=A0ABN3QEB1_9ACTN
MVAFGDESLPGSTERRHTLFASFSMTAVTQPPAAADTVGWPPARVLEPSPEEAPELFDALSEGEGLPLSEADEESEPPEHAAMSGAAASKVNAAADPTTLLRNSVRAMTYCSLHVRCTARLVARQWL